MQFEIKIDPAVVEPKVLITTATVTEEVLCLLEKITDQIPFVLSGKRDGKIELLEQNEIVRIYASNGKVFAVTTKGNYRLKIRLYEAQEQLRTSQFVRISNSEIINLKKVSCFDLNFVGTICVQLNNGDVTYVSRRYVSKIKKILGR